MISLVLLPIILYTYSPIIKKESAIKIYLLRDTKDDGSSLHYYSKWDFYMQIRKKKINTVLLDGDHDLNIHKLEFIQNEARKLKFYNDTNTVIKVHLSPETHYNEFIQLLNIMLYDKHKRYALADDDFYILGESPPDPVHEFHMTYL